MMWRCSGTVILLLLSSARTEGKDINEHVDEGALPRNKVDTFVEGAGFDTHTSEVKNVNKDLEMVLAWRNWRTISTGNQTMYFARGTFQNISYKNGKLIGRDSLERTANCTVTSVEDNHRTNLTYDLHIGYELLSMVFDELVIEDQPMSAIVSVLNNSAQLTFSVRKGEKKCVAFDVMRLTSLSNVRFQTSRPEYSNYDLEDILQNAVLPKINEHLEQIRTDPELLAGLQSICEYFPDTYTVLTHFITAILPL